MDHLLIEILGYASGVLIINFSLMQARKSWKTRSTKDLSLRGLLSYTAGLILLVVYAFIIGSLPIAIMNAIALALVFSTLILKLRHK